MGSPYNPPRAEPRHSPQMADAASSPPQQRESLYQNYYRSYNEPLSPPWRSWSRPLMALASVAFALAMGIPVLVVVFLSPKIPMPDRARLFSAAMIAKPVEIQEEEGPIATPPAAAAATAERRADASLDRKGRSPVAGGLLFIPESFTSADGAYDLVIHFHGNTELVKESLYATKLNTVVLIMNLGIGSAVYEDRFAYTGMFPEILDRIRTTLTKRGLRDASLRHLALTAWSAGYGAIARILDQPALVEKVNAVLLLDSPHVGFSTGTHELCPGRLAPFERFAKQAVEGNKLFSITHSNITPNGDYGSTRATSNAILKHVGATRTPGGEATTVPTLAAVDGVLPKKSLLALVPDTEAHLGGLHVRGYAGDQAEQHIMHLVQMSVTALPDLIRYWSMPTPR